MSIPALDAYRSSKPCREYQLAVAEQVVSHLGDDRIPLMVMPTGAGKSRTAAEVMGMVAKRRGLVVTHTDVLFEQSKSTIPGCSVINIQALTKTGAAGDKRRAALSEFDAAFVDECFVASTIVSAVGDVRATSFRPAPSRLIDIDGVVSTPDHPYLTVEGWKRAEDIKPGDMCCVRVGNVSQGQVRSVEKDMLPRVSLEEIERDHDIHQLRSRECKATRREQHHQSSRGKSKSERGAQGEESSTTHSWRERPWAYVAGIEAGQSYRSAPAVSHNARRRTAVPLQVGPSFSIGALGSGDRRQFAQNRSGEVQRCAEDGALGWERVDRVEVHERGGYGRYEEVCPDGRVYNLQTDSGVYFAGKWLVHNCHHSVSAQWIGAMQMLRTKGLKVFGASATPQRGDGRALDEFWTDMVVGPNYSELVEWGFLCPCDVAKPKLTRREQKKQKVRIDGVQSYLEHGKRADGSWRPGIYFDKTIADCEDAARRFNEAGIRSKVISCEITGQARQDIFDEYSRGDLDMLCSPQALAEGFDSPRAEVCVLCRSASSLGTYLQMVGRILRPAPGKPRALLIDCTDAVSIHGVPTKDRRYSLSGEGITDAPEEEELTPEQEHELRLREEWKQVRAEFDIVRDQLQTKLYELRQEAVEQEKSNGWAFAQFRKHVQYKDERGFTHDTIKVPYIFDAKKQHVCECCRHRVKVGEIVLSGRDKKVFHSDCWARSLSDEELTAYKMKGAAVAAQ